MAVPIHLIEPIDFMINHDMYGPYDPMTRGDEVTICTNDITAETYEYFYDSLVNLLRDGIEREDINRRFIHVIYADGVMLDLVPTNLHITLIMWYLLVATKTPICARHTFWRDDYTQDEIKDYIDDFFIEPNRRVYSNRFINNTIADMQYRFHDIDDFALYMGNTVNLEDSAELMLLDPEYAECLYPDLEGVGLQDINDVGNRYSAKSIQRIKQAERLLGYPHCLAPAFRSKQGVNTKQYKETAVSMGVKPGHNGQDIMTFPVKNSFINGGMADAGSYFVDSASGRNAQIIKFNNVGSSGFFARLLGLNNMDSRLYDDSPVYDCGSRHYIRVVPKDIRSVRMLNNRYYRLHPNGVERLLNWKEVGNDLIGVPVYLRSPITCACAARGHGVCAKCYGDLAYTLFDYNTKIGPNIGRIASEMVSSKLTQKLLSAKHLLEAQIRKLIWSEHFDSFFEVEFNIIKIAAELESSLNDYSIMIDTESIGMENEEDDDLFVDAEDDDNAALLFNEYITAFDVVKNSTGEVFHITTADENKLYLTGEINSIIRRRIGNGLDPVVTIKMSEIKDNPLFVVSIDNDELSKTLKRLEDLLNNNSTMRNLSLDELVQNLLDTNVKGGLNVSSVHIELILMNQIRSATDILGKPDWNSDHPEYQILSLNGALTNNPSITISFQYQKIYKMLSNPLTYQKTAPSFMDLFSMEYPQYAIRGLELPTRDEIAVHKGWEPGANLQDPMYWFESDPNGATVGPTEEIEDSPQ